jgi:flavin reductase (DIM6/NTAB) family NADH-FMN oxidoreductase RutF
MRSPLGKRPFPLSHVYRLLEPGPVVLITTAQKRKVNVMTLSWHTMMEFEPPIIGCVMSNRNYSFELLKTTRECVINIPTLELAPKVVACGNTTGRKIDKFASFGLTSSTASRVRAPFINECYANLECKVIDTRLVSKYNFFILEVIKAWISSSEKQQKTIHHMGRGTFMVAGKIIKLPSKMK